MTTPRMELSVDQRELVRLRIAMKAELDGAGLKRDLVAAFNVALEPGINQVKGKLASIPHHGAVTPSPGLGDYIAPRVKASVRLSGRSIGVAVRIPQTPKLRNFPLGARWLNRPKWSHPVFGRGLVDQYSPIPGYFDDAFREDREAYREACIVAVQWIFRRIAYRSKV